jgi:tetratricopeptide (TPR) repeat protein
VLGKIYYLRQEHDRAIKQLRETVDLNPGFAMNYLFLGKAYREQGKFSEAIEAHQMALSLSQGSRVLGELGYTQAVSGRQREARTLLQEMLKLSESEYVSAHSVALVYAGLGETEVAVDWLERAYQERVLGLAWVKVDPTFNALKANPDFKDLLRRMDLEP